MCHGWRSSKIDLALSADDFTEDVALMGLSDPAPTSAPSKTSRSGISWMG